MEKEFKLQPDELLKINVPITFSQQQEITNYINAYRNLHQVGNLVWGGTIATFSQSWADYLLGRNMFSHSGNPLYGENLAYFSGYGTDVMTLLKLTVDAWYNENVLYDYSKPAFSSETGHFTCLVWKNSTKFGMGISINVATGKAIVSMNTSPPGNVQGQFVNNVFPPTIIPIPIFIPEPIPVPVQYIKPIVIGKLNGIINDLRYGNSYYTTYYATVNLINLVKYLEQSKPF